MIKNGAKSKIPTQWGTFTIYVFTDADNKEHIVLVKEFANTPLVRIHSECFTGDVLASQRCDCGEQLQKSIKKIGTEGGVLIYLSQEGRGIGLANKIKAYALQDKGMDTIEANHHLGFKMDERDFTTAVEILQYFKITKIKLMTNNPKKIMDLEKNNISVERLPLLTIPNEKNVVYLTTKKEKMGHLLQ
jgi:GTP cyclohydrolase II